MTEHDKIDIVEDDGPIVHPGGGEEIPLRRAQHKGQWYYSVIDLISYLVPESKQPSRYYADLKRRAQEEEYTEVFAKCEKLKMLAPDGKRYPTEAADRETLFRIVQSVDSPRAEVWKLFLAQSGEQRLQEFEDPELSIAKAREAYRLKGYDEAWIEKRVQSIVVRKELTHEWDQRGASKQDYPLLTNDVQVGTFDKNVRQHTIHKGLTPGKHKLRDHMKPMELILTMLGEETTKQFHQERESQGVSQLRQDAKDGGALAGRTRKDLEQQGIPTVSRENYLELSSQQRNELQVKQPPLLPQEQEKEE